MAEITPPSGHGLPRASRANFDLLHAEFKRLRDRVAALEESDETKDALIRDLLAHAEEVDKRLQAFADSLAPLTDP